MFDFTKQVNDENYGYELRITYHRGTNRYSVTGYVIDRNNKGSFDHHRDGATRFFPSLQTAMTHIIDYNNTIETLRSK